MEPVMVAEVLDKSGRVHTRVRLAHYPVSIGRAYHNDLILDDEFVSPEHARIELDETGKPVVVDLDSDNGTFLLPGLTRIARHPLGEESLLRLGHTLIRLRRADYQVPPARRDSLGLTRATRWLTQGAGAAITSLFALALVALEHAQASAEAISGEQLLLAALPVAVVLPVWAGIWALVSRSFAHHVHFVPHLAIAGAAVVGFFLLDTLAQYYAFAFSAQMSADLVFQVAAIVVAGTALYGHLRFATLLTPRAVGLAAFLSALLLVGVASISDYVARQEFSDELPYPGELKPPAFAPGKATNPARFAEEAQSLVPHLDSGELD